MGQKDKKRKEAAKSKAPELSPDEQRVADKAKAAVEDLLAMRAREDPELFRNWQAGQAVTLGELLGVTNEEFPRLAYAGSIVHEAEEQGLSITSADVVEDLVRAFPGRMGDSSDEESRMPSTRAVNDARAAQAVAVLHMVAAEHGPAISDASHVKAAMAAWAAQQAAGPANVCSYCGEESSRRMQMCSQCRTARYCSRACMGAAWPLLHKPVCKQLREERVLIRQQNRHPQGGT